MTDARPRLAGNVLLSLIGLGAPLIVGILVMPVIVRHLGPVRFGLLGLAWAVLEYLALLDLGLGRATTKFVAEHLKKRSAQLSEIVTASVAGQLLLGVVGGTLLALLTPWLIGGALPVSPAIVDEARAVLYRLALAVPLTMLAIALRAVLEGAQRFDVVTAIRVPSSAALFAIPAIAAPLGVSLPDIILMMLLARVVTCSALIVAVGKVLPGLRWTLPHNAATLRPLLSFGGWVAISNFINPLLLYLDRFLLAAVAGLAAVAFYTPPFEATIRLLLVPAALGTALFPMISTLSVDDERPRIALLFGAATRTLFLLLVAPVVVGFVFAPELLGVWLGDAFADRSATALRILLVGLLVNALAHVPNGWIQATGRPDITAKFHLAELAIHVPLTWVAITRLGIAGAALAWTIRVSLDAGLLFGAASRRFGISPSVLLAGRGRALAVAVAALVLGVAAAAVLLGENPAACVLAVSVVLLAFARFTWDRVLDPVERSALRSLAWGGRPRSAATYPGGSASFSAVPVGSAREPGSSADAVTARR